MDKYLKIYGKIIQIGAKNEEQNLPKIEAKKVSKINAKRFQNDAKMHAQINDFSYFFEKGENAPDPLFPI